MALKMLYLYEEKDGKGTFPINVEDISSIEPATKLIYEHLSESTPSKLIYDKDKSVIRMKSGRSYPIDKSVTETIEFLRQFVDIEIFNEKDFSDKK